MGSEMCIRDRSSIAQRLEADFPDTNRGRGVRLFPLWKTPFNNAGALLPTLGIALVVVLAVLLIACANVGNLLLVRAFARQQEMTIRLSVGATRARMVQQLITEGLILSAIAAAGGLLVANWLRDALALLTPPRGGVLLRLPGRLDWHVLLASAVVCLVSTVLFAAVPAILTSSVDLAAALRSQSGSVVGTRGRSWVRSTLVLVQISLSFVLLVGAGLLIQSLQGVRNADPGFSTEGVLTTSVNLFTAGYDVRRAKIFQDELIDRLRGVAGVQASAFSRLTPFTYASYSSAPIAVDGYDAPPDRQPTADYNEVGPAFCRRWASRSSPVVSSRARTMRMHPPSRSSTKPWPRSSGRAAARSGRVFRSAGAGCRSSASLGRRNTAICWKRRGHFSMSRSGRTSRRRRHCRSARPRAPRRSPPCSPAKFTRSMRMSRLAN